MISEVIILINKSLKDSLQYPLPAHSFLNWSFFWQVGPEGDRVLYNKGEIRVTMQQFSGRLGGRLECTIEWPVLPKRWQRLPRCCLRHLRHFLELCTGF